MKKKYDEDESEYFDGEDKKPKLFIVIGVVLILFAIVFLLFTSCNKDTKSTNNYLSGLRVTNGKIEPSFSKNTLNYNVYVTEDVTTVVCSAESNKANVVGCDTKLDLTKESTSHNVVVTSEEGKTKTYSLTIIKSEVIDAVKHTATIVGNVKSGISTSGKVVLEANSDYENADYTYQWYKDDTELDGATSNRYVALESGKYVVEITNPTSLYSATSDEYEVIINEKDESTPITPSTPSSYTLKITSISGVGKTWSKSNTISVEVNASNGIANKAYSFDGGKNFQASNTKTFTSNKTVKIVVKDSKGNTVSKSINLDKIDSTIPKVTITPSNKTSSSVKLVATVTPSTTKSGYTYQWYKESTKITGATMSSYTVTSEGTYKVIVKTGAGNSATSSSYTFSKLVNNLTCPILTVSTESGNFIDQKSWTTENILITIKPTTYTTGFDVYLNGTGNYSSISQTYTYLNFYTSTIKLKVSEKGQRVVKIVVKDNNGNTKDCYSKPYYLK